MECSKCGSHNPTNSQNCVKCGYDMVLESNEKDYCITCGKPLLFPNKPCPYCKNSFNTSDQALCRECNSPIRKGIFFPSIKKLSELEKAVLGIIETENLCDRCIGSKKTEAIGQIDTFKNKFQDVIDNMPVISVHNPSGLNVRKYFNVITAQSVVDVDSITRTESQKSLWNNYSSEFEYKLNLGEKNCILTLKKKALNLGANAVIGSDIEYAELSSEKHRFLVVMMGTAVLIDTIEPIAEYELEVFNLLAK